jgi:RND family efflux transporter MFP subunit
MDIQRPATNKKRNRRIAAVVAIGASFALLTAVAWSVARRPPGVDGDLIFNGDVRRGEFVYEVTAAGSLYAPEIRSVTAQSEGVVERIYVLAGHTVNPDDVLMELSSPNLQQELADAIAEINGAEADEIVRRAEAEDNYLNLESAVADATAAFETAKLEADAYVNLAEEQAASTLDVERKVNTAAQLERRMEIAQAQFDRYPAMRTARDAAAQSKLDQQRRKVQRLQERVEDLEVRAGSSGVVQEVAVEEGERLSAGNEVARVVNPEFLIARVRVSERDAALVEPGQAVRLEMGRESIAGKVTRVDPAVSERLVTVDVDLVGKPTRQLRPDLTVTARIEIERVAETLVVDRPPQLRDDQEIVELFRFLDADGRRAERVRVEVGRRSAREVEILSGLKAGDRIILADMTDWLEESVIRIR